ncbi:MAG: glutaredoxin 3 [Alphaproteobacteria bacterium]
MPEIIVYSGPNCPYCVHVKDLFTKKGAKFKEIDVRADAVQREEMIAKTGGKKTIPQIFIDGKYIGDDDDIDALNAAGKLDALLGI